MNTVPAGCTARWEARPTARASPARSAPHSPPTPAARPTIIAGSACAAVTSRALSPRCRERENVGCILRPGTAGARKPRRSSPVQPVPGLPWSHRRTQCHPEALLQRPAGPPRWRKVGTVDLNADSAAATAREGADCRGIRSTGARTQAEEGVAEGRAAAKAERPTHEGRAQQLGPVAVHRGAGCVGGVAGRRGLSQCRKRRSTCSLIATRAQMAAKISRGPAAASLSSARPRTSSLRSSGSTPSPTSSSQSVTSKAGFGPARVPAGP